MDDKRWIELAKRKKQDKYFGFISLLIVVMMVFFTVKNIGWLLTFIVVAVILYFWIDVEQMLEDSDAISRTFKIVFIVMGTMYELVSIIFAFVNLDYLLVVFGIISAGYLGFKTNAVLRKDLKNKNLKFADSMIATFLGIGVASLIVAFIPRDILWLFLLIFALAYNLLHLIVRIKIEHDGTNRQL
ncbi:MAG: beta-carotene 15,15'-monooxygenase [Lactobacillus sp.]|uniref:beta-carotene 15,15'-monooxygenase n=1 Tax=Lactobacillus sp. TaxID=1591 RepID=UPI0023D39B8F|nr:beta-carotene 15,15'-monooxygenase [Lactobacillus sp.]MDE7051114.1 beta-carotene 15,15'-monooxygenase [Lactobacillus sp.]